MQAVFVFGRILFVAYFVFAGLQRLMNIAAGAEFFSRKIGVPAAFSGLAGQIEGMVGLSMPQILALLAGAIELGAALLIAFNVGTRVMAVVLIVMTAVGIYYVNDFWTMSGSQRDENLTQAFLQVSLIGGLVVLATLGSATPARVGRPTGG